MSIKTLRKRIALVAAAALAVTGLSTVPANAAPTAFCVSKLTEDDGAVLTSAQFTANPILNANCISAMTVVAGSALEVGVIPIGAILAGDNGEFYAEVRNLQVLHASADPGAVASGATFLLDSYTTPSVPGTYTIDVWYDHNGDGNANDVGTLKTSVSLTLTAATDFSQALTTAYMTAPAAGAGVSSAATNLVPRTGSKDVNTDLAQIQIDLQKADGTDDDRAHVVTVDIAGAGYVSVDDTAGAPGGVITSRSDTDNTAQSERYVHIQSDGTAGTGTVTVSVTHLVTGAKVTLGTWSVTSYGSVAKLEVATSNFTVGLAGGDTTGYGSTTRTAAGNLLGALDNATTVPAFIIKMTDSAGRVANAGAAPTVVPSNLAVVVSGACGLDDGSAAATGDSSSVNGVGFYNCSFTTATSAKSGDKATLTFRIVDPADATKFLTATADVTVGGSVATETLSFNKATYAPGEAMVITRTAKDSSGNPVADGTASPAITFSTATGGTLPGARFYNKGVSATSTSAATAGVFAPVVSGAFKAVATSGNAAGDTITADASVASPIDAQIASLIAAIAKLQAAIAKINKRLKR